MRRIDEEGANTLVPVGEPVNKFPDFVRYAVQRLKALCPSLGKIKITDMLCRAGLHLGTTTVDPHDRRESPTARDSSSVRRDANALRAVLSRSSGRAKIGGPQRPDKENHMAPSVRLDYLSATQTKAMPS